MLVKDLANFMALLVTIYHDSITYLLGIIYSTFMFSLYVFLFSLCRNIEGSLVPICLGLNDFVVVMETL